MRQLKDYQEFLTALFRSICEDAKIESDMPLSQILREPKLIVAMNHATALSWIPAISFLTMKVVENGGGDRLPLGVVDQFFFKNPLTLPVAEYITQSREPRNFDQLLSELKTRDQVDLVLFPEGARTFFGNLDEIQQFRSSRFVELSILSGAPILLAVHRGSESWNLPLQLPKEWGAFILPFSQFFGKNLMNFGSLNLPLKLNKIPKFRMKVQLYKPSLFESDLAGNPHERKLQIEEEAAHIRLLMQEMWESLADSPARPLSVDSNLVSSELV